MEYICCWTLSKGWSDQSSTKPKPCKLVVVGDTGCGKTCLIFRFTRGRLPCAGEEATALETDEVEIIRNKTQINLTVHDTSGSEEYARVRALTYAEADGVIICFPLDSQESLHRVVSDWAAEVRHLCKGKPYLLVGTKKDLRDKASSDKIKQGCVSRKQGQKIAKTIGAAAYLECSATDSAKGKKEVNRIFGRALRESVL